MKIRILLGFFGLAHIKMDLTAKKRQIYKQIRQCNAVFSSVSLNDFVAMGVDSYFLGSKKPFLVTLSA